MGSDGIVLAPPLLDQHGRLRQRVEDLPVQQLVPELAVEALVVAVLPRAARLDKEHLDAHAPQPPPHELRRALPHGEVPDALRRIRSANAPESARLAVELIVLTAARSGEARAATWDEIDTAAKVWTIPPARMKAGREHRVPLSSGVLDVLRRASELAGDSPFVFPTRAGRALSSKSTYRVLQLAGVTGTTLHGFRTSIRVWMAETGVDRETAEAVLAHVVRGTEGAYMRSDLLARRCEVMQAWSDYVA